MNRERIRLDWNNGRYLGRLPSILRIMWAQGSDALMPLKTMIWRGRVDR